MTVEKILLTINQLAINKWVASVKEELQGRDSKLDPPLDT